MNTIALEQQLKASSLHSLLLVTSKMLSRSGFGDVQILDRREPRQKSRHGGHELLCETMIGQVPIRVVVKVINYSIRLRMLDELSGVMRRMHAHMGLLISPHHLTASAQRYQADYRLNGVEVIDGKGFAQQLTQLGIGTRAKGSVDYAFFGALEEASQRISEFMKKEERDRR